MYDAYESRRDSGAPVELYEFTLEGSTWRYTSADADQSWGGETFEAVPLGRSEIDESAEINRQNLQITVTVDHPVADLYRMAPPAGMVLLRIRRMHRGDSEAEAVIIWMGRVLNCEWSGREAILAAEPLYTSIRAPGLRRMYSRLCPHVLYGTACRANPDAFGSAATVTSVAGLAVQVSGAHSGTAGYWAGGLLAWVDGLGHTRRVAIESHSGSGQIRLIAPLPGLAAGAAVTLWPGCDHTLTSCREKFDNRENFGGFKWIPGVNPFNVAVF
jgi:uncharacterized phage protein (TIGR02218 family)